MRGGDTSALRAFNERQIIGAIRRQGPLSKADLGRATGLSAQAASTIVNDLLRSGLLQKEPKVRGQVGQPYTPIALAPTGAFSLGLKIGRRSVEAVLLDFMGDLVRTEEARYQAPVPAVALPLARQCVQHVVEELTTDERARLIGLGIAMPGDLWAWSAELGLEPEALAALEDRDVGFELARATGLETELYNDATAACAAELALGPPVSGSALYIYVGTFIGGGLILDGRLYRGARDNAGAIGSMPMVAPDATGRPRQLIHEASVFVLERQLWAAGVDASGVIDGTAAVAGAEPIIASWTRAAAEALARAVVSAASVVDFELVIVDGLLAAERIDALTSALKARLGGYNDKGLASFTVRSGSVGRPARVLGAGLLPLNERFSPDPDVLTAGPTNRTRVAP